VCRVTVKTVRRWARAAKIRCLWGVNGMDDPLLYTEDVRAKAEAMGR